LVTGYRIPIIFCAGGWIGHSSGRSSDAGEDQGDRRATFKPLGSDVKAAQLTQQLDEDVQLDRGYIVLLVGAALMAAIGLEQNSASTIIGAMVVAPLMLPIRALGYGLLHFGKLVPHALRTLVLSILIIIPLSALVGLASGRPEFGTEILSRTNVTFLALGVAVVGGSLSALSRIWHDSKVTDSLIGVGISVSLVPPLCTVGITLAAGEWFYAWNAFLLFFTNFVGIALACMIVFWLAGYQTEVRSRAYAGLAVFVILLTSICPSLYMAGSRARQESSAAAFINSGIGTYIPTTLAVESVIVNWKTAPASVTATIHSEHKPTAAQVRSLNDALNAYLRHEYKLVVVADPAVAVPTY
jgi:uncharacterized hydrophobic protein (TIGR00271 family)